MFAATGPEYAIFRGDAEDNEASTYLIRHPEVAAKRPSKGDSHSASAVVLRGSALRTEHLRMTE